MPTTSSSATTLPMSLRLPGLRAARLAAQLTQTALAEALKTSATTISHIERGGRVSRDFARACAWKLFVPVEDLRRTRRAARPTYLRLLEQAPAIAVGLDLSPTAADVATAAKRAPGITAEQVQARMEATRLYERQRAAFEQARDAGLLGDPQVNKRLYCLTGEAVAAIQRCRDLGAPWQGPKLSSGRQSGQARRR